MWLAVDNSASVTSCGAWLLRLERLEAATFHIDRKQRTWRQPSPRVTIHKVDRLTWFWLQRACRLESYVTVRPWHRTHPLWHRTWCSHTHRSPCTWNLVDDWHPSAALSHDINKVLHTLKPPLQTVEVEIVHIPFSHKWEDISHNENNNDHDIFGKGCDKETLIQ